MRIKIILSIFIVTLSIPVYFLTKEYLSASQSGAPPYDLGDPDPAEDDSYSWIDDWKRPDEPVTVGLQVGHWKNNELPDDLEKLRGNTGSSGGGKSEWEVNLDIAERTALLLNEKGIKTDILPATVPPGYWADAFIAIHADGSLDPSTRGFKISGPRRDFSGSASKLAESISKEYGESTKLPVDSNISRNMRGYYAFAWWRNKYAVHPKTPSVILETGFLSSPQDRKIILSNPSLSAKGLTNGVLNFLESVGLL